MEEKLALFMRIERQEKQYIIDRKDNFLKGRLKVKEKRKSLTLRLEGLL